MIVESEEDVAATLQYAQKWKLDLVVASGRHSYYGASSTTGGIVIDLQKLRKVSIDLESKTATAQGGCKAVDLEEPLAVEGYSVVMGAFNDTGKFAATIRNRLTILGIGGLTLGGGSGLLTGQYGLVIDNLLAARVVLADGRVLEASESTNPDLFWGIRGGGTNFGVVVSFTYRIHKQGDVFFGPLIFTPDKTPAILETLSSMAPTITKGDGKLAIFVAFMKAPGMPSVHAAVLPFYDGPEAEAMKHLQPIFDLGPAMSMVKMQPYADITKPSPLVMGPLTHQHYSTSNAPLVDFDVEIITPMIADLDGLFNKYGDAISPAKIALEIRSYAKSSAIDPSATALRARSPGVMCVFEVQHDGSADPVVLRADIKAIMDKVRVAVKEKHPKSGAFFNANIGVGTEKVKDMFGDNLPRLKELKRKYDPGFVFNKWYPVSPAEE